MAEAKRFICNNCQRTVEAWSDGNPYYVDESGAKHYAYHPNHADLDRCVGNDVPHLCLSCGEAFSVDSQKPVEICPRCGAREVRRSWTLGGCRCPFCNGGTLEVDEGFFLVS